MAWKYGKASLSRELYGKIGIVVLDCVDTMADKWQPLGFLLSKGQKTFTDIRTSIWMRLFTLSTVYFSYR